MQLWLKPALAQNLINHARSSIPNECCGVIVGRGIEGYEVIPVPNTATDPTQNYRMDEQTLTHLFFQAQRENKDIIAFYHSHPNTDTIPSQTDIQLASYPDTPYLIASLRGGEARLAGWSIKQQRVSPVTVVVSENRPASEAAGLSIIQKRAIIASVIIAFIFMLVLSLSLLPPAPIIPVP